MGRNFPDRTCAKLLSLYKKRPKTNSGTSLVEVGSKVYRLLLMSGCPVDWAASVTFFETPRYNMGPLWNKNACLGGILAFNARASQQRRPYLIRRSLKGKSNDVGRLASWSTITCPLYPVPTKEKQTNILFRLSYIVQCISRAKKKQSKIRECQLALSRFRQIKTKKDTKWSKVHQ